MSDTIVPVFVGGDIGVYALARAFHEEFSVRSIAVVSVSSGALRDSAIITQVVRPGIRDCEVLIDTLNEIADEHRDSTLILMTNSDWFVEMLSSERERLSAYRFGMVTPELFTEVSNKTRFAQIAASVGMRTPKSVSVWPARMTPESVDALELPFEFPIVAKPADSAVYHHVDFPGKEKVFELEEPEELRRLLRTLVEVSYQGEFLIQEYIPGGDTAIGSLTAYRDSKGNVTMMCAGQVLLEEYEPDALGIPAAIMTRPDAEAFAAAKRFLDACDYHTFANFDFKRDAKGHAVFFEVNPRIGRNNYYVTASGLNVAKYLVADLLNQPIEPSQEFDRIVYTVVPVALLLRYLPNRLRKVVSGLALRRKVANPLRYVKDYRPQRAFVVEARTANMWRKFARWYPR